jgi:hypothetical protein
VGTSGGGLNVANGNAGSAGGLGLIVKDRQANSLSSEVGVHLARPVKLSQGALVPLVSAAWKYDFQIDKLSVPAAFAARPDVGFAMDSREIGGVRAVLAAEIALSARKVSLPPCATTRTWEIASFPRQ